MSTERVFAPAHPVVRAQFSISLCHASHACVSQGVMSGVGGGQELPVPQQCGGRLDITGVEVL